jgi:hypothetical protein
MESPNPLRKIINRVLLLHNYSFLTLHNISQKGNHFKRRARESKEKATPHHMESLL